jgi:N-acetyltransferase
MSFADAPTLSNALVTLEALRPGHEHDLARAVEDGELWRTWYTHIPAPGEMAAEIERRVEAQSRGEGAYWAVVDAVSGHAVGMTSYLHLDPANRRLEIGSTWLGRGAQGTGTNPAAKLLLLTRAFESLSCMAVEFRTHWHNQQSRAAIARLGARQDGVLRNHILWQNGTVRDTVVFSIIDGEWPAVRAGLEARVERALRARA